MGQVKKYQKVSVIGDGHTQGNNSGLPLTTNLRVADSTAFQEEKNVFDDTISIDIPSETISYSKMATKPSYLLVKTEYKTVKLPIDDILFFEGKGNYVSIYTKDQVIVTLLTMSKLEQTLGEFGFFRIHKSYIVSFKCIDALWNDKVAIKDRVIPVGGQYRERFLQYLNRNSISIN